MSEAEHEEYMKNVRWKTFGYVAFIAAGLLISGTGGIFIIKGDIKGLSDNIAVFKSDTKRDINDLRVENKDDIKELKHYVDSLHKEDMNKIVAKRVINDGCVIQKMVNGERKYITVPCN